MKIVGWKIPSDLKVVSMTECGGHLWILTTSGYIMQVESICERTTTWPEHMHEPVPGDDHDSG